MHKNCTSCILWYWFQWSYQWDEKKHLKIHPGVLSMHLSANHLATSDEGIPPTEFGGEKWGNSLILKCSEKSGLGRRTVDRWEILQTHQLRLRSYYATIYGPGFIATSKTGFASCHAVPRSKKKVVQVQRELGLDYAFANTLEVDETTGRWSHEEMKTGWWFQIFFIFTPIWGNDPTWLIFFKWVETTN